MKIKLTPESVQEINRQIKEREYAYEYEESFIDDIWKRDDNMFFIFKEGFNINSEIELTKYKLIKEE